MKSLNDIRIKINASLEKVEAFRLEKVAAIAEGKKWHIIPGVLLIISVITGLIGTFILAAICGVFALIGFALVQSYKVQPHSEGYLSSFKEEVFHTFIKEVYPNAYYAPANYLPSNLFSNSQLFGAYDSYGGEDYFEGTTDNGCQFKFSELSVTDTTTTTDSDGNRETRTTTVFDGLFFVLDVPKKTYGRIQVLPDSAESSFGFVGKFIQKSLGSFFQGGSMVYMKDHPEFEKEFVVYSKDKEEVAHILTPGMIQAIYDLRYKWNLKLSVSFIDHQIYIALPTSKNFFTPDVNRSVLDDNLLNELYDELALCFAVVEDLSLDDVGQVKKTENPSNPFMAKKQNGNKNNGNPFLI